jgi:hypothetical protein
MINAAINMMHVATNLYAIQLQISIFFITYANLNQDELANKKVS